MKSFIVINNVTFSYPERQPINRSVLSDLNFSINEGEFIALVGQNGSGKSTLGKLMNALLIPDFGEVLINGMNTRDSASHAEIRRQVGMIFQRPQDQIVATTVAEDIAFGPGNLGLPSNLIRQRVEEALNLTGLAGFENRPSYLLSAGETQRVALAGVLAMRPKCVIFDETTAMLDPSGRAMVMQQAKTLNKAGITIIFITHLMEEAAESKRILVLHKGHLVLDGFPVEVFSSYDRIRSYGLDLPPAALAADSLRKYFTTIPKKILFADDLLDALPKYSGKIKSIKRLTQTVHEFKLCIEVKDLSHDYLRNTPLTHRSLDHCSLEVQAGTAHGIIGATGSGKSTLLQHLNGLILPQSGSVNVLGHLLTDPKLELKALRRSVGMAFQQPEDQIFEQYVGDEVAFAARNFEISGKISEIVRNAMRSVGLDFEMFKDRLTSTLSGGERRKAALASVLAGQPSVLLLDEPLAGLDPFSRQEISSYLDVLKKQGITLVISTHQYEDVLEVVDEISVFANGRDRVHGHPEEIFFNKQNLKNFGILPPLVSRISNRLHQLGWPIPAGIITLNELNQIVSSLIFGAHG